MSYPYRECHCLYQSGIRHYLVTGVVQRADMPKYVTPQAERKEFPQLIVHDGNPTADEAEDASGREEPRIRNRALAVQRSATATTGHYDTGGEGESDFVNPRTSGYHRRFCDRSSYLLNCSQIMKLN